MSDGMSGDQESETPLIKTLGLIAENEKVTRYLLLCLEKLDRSMGTMSIDPEVRAWWREQQAEHNLHKIRSRIMSSFSAIEKKALAPLMNENAKHLYKMHDK